MSQKNQKIEVQGLFINIKEISDEDYISLTDMAKSRNNQTTDTVIQAWIKRGNTLRFIELWEQEHNPNFKPLQMQGIKMELAQESNFLSAKQLIERAKIIGIQSRRGRYGGTFAHRDIAFEFATWLSPEFKYYLLKEFQRLKEQENNLLQREWNANRFLTKRNYTLHTEAIKNNLLPSKNRELDEEWITYAEEADLLNVALFGITAKEWRIQNEDKTRKGENMRDHATNIQLIILSNLEAINSELIREGLPKDERFYRLQQAALFQLGIFYRDKKELN